jgi:hypothetical protein
VKRLMNRLLLVGCALLVAGAAMAAAEKPGDTGVQKFGSRIKVKKSLDIAELAKDPGQFSGKKVRIEGTVKDVCQGKGCWVEVEASGASFLARSLNEKVLLPKDCKGWSIVVQGVVRALPAAAKEEAKAGAVAEGHACPAPQWVLDTQGVELKEPAVQ